MKKIPLKYIKCYYFDCIKPVFAKNLCRAHYMQKWENKSLKPLRNKNKYSHCSYLNCFRPHTAKGLCATHYQQKYTNNKPLKSINTYVKCFRKCSFPNCNRRYAAKGFCQAHYRQKFRSPTRTLKPIQKYTYRTRRKPSKTDERWD